MVKLIGFIWFMQELYTQYVVHAVWTVVAYVTTCGVAEYVANDKVAGALSSRAIAAVRRLDMLAALRAACDSCKND